jgi:hypothetical protein
VIVTEYSPWHDGFAQDDVKHAADYAVYDAPGLDAAYRRIVAIIPATKGR